MMTRMNQNLKLVEEALIILGIPLDKITSLTSKDARVAYHRTAREIHPDKADRNNQKQIDEFNEAFKKDGGAYERILQYIIDKLCNQNDKKEHCERDEAIFAKENFDKFNFPYENNGSFTVLVEDNLAELWQEC